MKYKKQNEQKPLFGKRMTFSKEPTVSSDNLAVRLLETQDRITEGAKNTLGNFPM